MKTKTTKCVFCREEKPCMFMNEARYGMVSDVGGRYVCSECDIKFRLPECNDHDPFSWLMFVPDGHLKSMEYAYWYYLTFKDFEEEQGSGVIESGLKECLVADTKLYYAIEEELERRVEDGLEIII